LFTRGEVGGFAQAGVVDWSWLEVKSSITEETVLDCEAGLAAFHQALNPLLSSFVAGLLLLGAGRHSQQEQNCYYRCEMALFKPDFTMWIFQISH
jgi:hypothetical protein